jgi:hypothetical protein
MVGVRFISSEGDAMSASDMTASRRKRFEVPQDVDAYTDGTMDWIRTQDLSAYRGKYIVAVGRRIVGVGSNSGEALHNAALPRSVVPWVDWVPDDSLFAL